MERKNYYSNLDIWKFISAVLVVFLHTVNISTLHGKAEFTRQWLFRLTQSVNPVEFFLMVTAFFLFKNLTYEKEQKYIVRLLKLYAFWSVLYLSGAARDCYEKNSSLIGTIKLLRRIFITGTSGHLWYILAVIYSLLFLFPLINKKKILSAWTISIICYLYVVTANSYSWLFANESIFSKAIECINAVLGNSYILRAPLFLMIGFGLSSFDFEKIPTFVCLMGWAICSFLCNFEIEKLSFWGGAAAQHY